MHEFLLTIALGFVTVWTNPHSGEPTYIKWCRDTGDCVATMTRVTEAVERVSLELDADPLYVMALVMTESQLNPKAKSRIGAFGLLQLHPRGVVGKQARRECRGKTRHECDEIVLRHAISMLKTWIDACPTLLHTTYSWRSGDCGTKVKERIMSAWNYSKKTIRLYERLREDYYGRLFNQG